MLERARGPNLLQLFVRVVVVRIFTMKKLASHATATPNADAGTARSIARVGVIGTAQLTTVAEPLRRWTTASARSGAAPERQRRRHQQLTAIRPRPAPQRQRQGQLRRRARSEGASANPSLAQFNPYRGSTVIGHLTTSFARFWSSCTRCTSLQTRMESHGASCRRPERDAPKSRERCVACRVLAARVLMERHISN